METNGRASRKSGRSVRWAALIAVAALFAVPISLFAHAHLRRSEPASHERLTAPPTAIRLWFSERPELGFTRVRLRGADSTDVGLGTAVRTADDPMGVMLPITGAVAAGTYTVLWRTAAADGHATTGSFTFDVVAGVPPTAASVDSTKRRAGNALVHVDSTAETLPTVNVSAATRWLEFMAMLAVAGAVVFGMVVLPRASGAMAGALLPETRLEIADSARRLARSALVLLLIAGLSRFYAEARALFGPDRAVDANAVRTVLGTSWGIGWIVGMIGICVAAVGFTLVKRASPQAGWGIAALGVLGIGVSPALTGHAMATRPVGLSLLADILHVIAACAWLGTLLALLFAALPLVRGKRSRENIGSGVLVASLVRAFHPVALTCAAIVIGSGLVSAWLRLPTLSALWDSNYGRVLLLKLLFVAVVVVLGALNWRRMLPTLGDEQSARRITRTASAELTVAALVLAITAILVSTSPPDRAIAPSAVTVTR
jgi:copper transport protein